MQTTIIFGGNGQVAKHLTRILTEDLSPSHSVYSIIRNPDQVADLTTLGTTPIVQSIQEASVPDLVATLKKVKPDVAIWCAGAGKDDDDGTRVIAVDRDGAIKAMDACAAAGVKRYITISALDVRDRSKPAPDWYDAGTKERTAKIWEAIGPFMEAKLAADKELVTGNHHRKLDYTIIRPGGLGTKPGTGRVSAGRVQLAQVIKREDLARVIVECMHEPGTIGLAIDVAAGEDPIPAAIRKVAAERTDTFDGFY